MKTQTASLDPSMTHWYDFYHKKWIKHVCVAFFVVSLLLLLISKFLGNNWDNAYVSVPLSASTLLFMFLAFPKLTSYVYERPAEFNDLIDKSQVDLTRQQWCQNIIRFVMCFVSAGLICWLIFFFEYRWPHLQDSAEVILGSIAGILSLYNITQNNIYNWLINGSAWFIRWKNKHLTCVADTQNTKSTNSSEQKSDFSPSIKPLDTNVHLNEITLQ